jgi:hypothetical protein
MVLHAPAIRAVAGHSILQHHTAGRQLTPRLRSEDMRESSKTKRAARVAGIVALSVAADILLHVMGPALSYSSPSFVFTHKLLFFPLVLATLAGYFLLGAWLTWRWRERFVGSRLRKAFRFAFVFGGGILAGVPAMALEGGGVPLRELYSAVADFLAILLMFWLLLRGTTSAAVVPSRGDAPSGLACGLLTAVAFVAAAFLFESIGLASPGAHGLALRMLPPAVMGFWAGASYAWLPWKDAGAQVGAGTYVISFFAPAWLGNVAFVPLFNQTSLASLASSYVANVVAAAVGLATYGGVHRWLRARHARAASPIAG